MVHSIIIIDTNILIQDLYLIENVVTNAWKLNVAIVIPWVVLQELDAQKSGANPSLRRKAQRAHDSLISWFEEQPNWIRGQKTNEYISSYENNDDKILDCCTYFKTYFSFPIILLSNDKNLRVKGAVHEITTHTSTELNDQFENAIKSFNHRMDTDENGIPNNKKNSTSNNGPILTDLVNIENNNEITMYDAPTMSLNHLPHEYDDKNNVEMKDYQPDNQIHKETEEFQYVSHCGPSVHYSIELYKVISSIIQYLEAHLNKQLKEHLERELGEMWDIGIKHMPPWTADQMVEIIDRKFDVLKNIYPKELKVNLYQLKGILKSWRRLLDYNLGKLYKKDALKLLEFTELLLMLGKDQRTEVNDRRSLLKHFECNILKCREP